MTLSSYELLQSGACSTQAAEAGQKVSREILTQFASKCFTTSGWARELKLSERGSSRNRENRSHRNRREGLSEEVWQGRELPKSRQEAFLANAGALPAMV